MSLAKNWRPPTTKKCRKNIAPVKLTPRNNSTQSRFSFGYDDDRQEPKMFYDPYEGIYIYMSIFWYSYLP